MFNNSIQYKNILWKYKIIHLLLTKILAFLCWLHPLPTLEKP